MLNIFSYPRQLTALLAFSMLLPAVALSQVPENADQENVQMIVGDILEIQPSHTFSNPVYSWILTQDRTFIQAGRAEAFRYRFIQPGMYTLIAEVAAGDQMQRVRRTFMIEVATRTAQTDASAMPTENNDELVTVEPAPDDEDRVTLITGSRLIRIKPIDPNIRPLALDLDTATDSDGDGSASNDLDSDQTFFQTDATPLYIWFASPLTTQEMSVTALDASGEPMNQTIDVMTEEYALEQGLVTSAVEVTIVQQKGLDYLFTARFSRPLPPSTPLLYHWEFGDGTQSLLINPSHTYAENGSYAVTLRVRNLADGKEVASYEQQLEVTGGTPGDAPPEKENTGGEVPEDPIKNSIPWASIFLYGGIGLGTLLLGLLAYMVLRFVQKRGSKLADKLEEIEQTIVKKDEKAEATPHLAIAVPATAVKTPVTPPPASISKREEELAKPTPQASPKIDEANSPAWLKSGLKAATSAAPATPPTPTPAKPAPSAPKPSTPVPPPAPIAAKPAPAPAAPAATPSWLQQPAAKQAPATPVAPTPVAPKPQAPVAAPAPVAPKPQVAAAPVVPAPTPAAPVVPAPVPKPVAPAAPAPAPQVVTPVTPAPVSVTPPPQSAMLTPPAAPVKPAPTTAPATQTDQPIAIIRAESLNPEKPKSPPEPQDIKPA